MPAFCPAYSDRIDRSCSRPNGHYGDHAFDRIDVVQEPEPESVQLHAIVRFDEAGPDGAAVLLPGEVLVSRGGPRTMIVTLNAEQLRAIFVGAQHVFGSGPIVSAEANGESVRVRVEGGDAAHVVGRFLGALLREAVRGRR